jgi:thioredoxin-related protein
MFKIAVHATLRRAMLALGLILLPGLAVANSNPNPNPNVVSYTRNLPADGELARRAGVPLLVIFTAPDCAYCDRVMHYYLIPMQRNPDYANKVMVRRVQMTSTRALVDFDGKPTTSRQFAQHMKVTLAPTIIVFTPAGKPAGKPLIGLSSEDYYGGYMDAAIDAGHAAMQSAAQ